MHHLSEQEIIRRDNLTKLKDAGVEAYPSESFDVNAFCKDVKDQFKDGDTTFQSVSMAGRLMSRRIMGKASFAELQDSSGRIQIYISRDDICPEDDKTLYNDVFKKWLDLGDFIGIKGFAFYTQMGECTIHVTELKVLSKSLRPLPVVKVDDTGKVHDAFTDPEMRYRQRYVDLIVNPEVRETFKQRTAMYTSMRNYLNERGYLEVETPILQPLYGGAAARPFTTHHNTLDMKLYLRIANELYLKKIDRRRV